MGRLGTGNPYKVEAPTLAENPGGVILGSRSAGSIQEVCQEGSRICPLWSGAGQGLQSLDEAGPKPCACPKWTGVLASPEPGHQTQAQGRTPDVGTQTQDGRRPDLWNQTEVQVTELVPKNSQGDLLLRPSGQFGPLTSFPGMNRHANRHANRGAAPLREDHQGPQLGRTKQDWLPPPSGVPHCSPATTPACPFAYKLRTEEMAPWSKSWGHQAQ